MLPWLRDIRADSADIVGLPPYAQRWSEPSRNALVERLRGSDRVFFFSAGVFGSRDHEEALETARFLRGLADAVPTRKLVIIAATGLPATLARLTGSDLAAAEILARLEQDRRLEFHRLPPAAFSNNLPRVLATGADGLSAIFSDEGDRPLLDALLPGRIYTCANLADDDASLLQKTVADAVRVPDAVSSILADTRRWDFKPGDVRDLTEPFAAATRAEAINILIRDPYLLSGERNRRMASQFVEALCDMGVTIGKLTTIWRQDDPRKHGAVYEAPHLQEMDFRARLKQLGLGNIRLSFDPRPAKTGEHFHDRQIIADVQEGNKASHLRWDVSSGIDNLMDQRKEAVVYACKI